MGVERLRRACALLSLAALTTAAAALSSDALQPLIPSGASAVPGASWAPALLPGQRIASTAFRVVQADGQPALQIEADASYGNLLQRLTPASAQGTLSWRWRVEKFNLLADLRSKAGDDTSVKVCVLYDLPVDQVPFVERQLLRVARAGSATDLPAATICYVWDAALPVGSRIDNPYSRRVRYLVLRSGQINRWATERRDLAADFRTLFGDELAAGIPPVQAIAVGADADNTAGHSIAWLADLRLNR